MTALRIPPVSARMRLVATATVLVIISGAACTWLGRTALTPNTMPAPLSEPGGRAVAQPAGLPAPGPQGDTSQPAGLPGPAPQGGPTSTSPSSSSSAAPASTAASGAQPQSSDTTAPDTSAQILDRMVIRNASLSVEVQDIESALARARAIASQDGGFVSSSDTHVDQTNSQQQYVAQLTLQVRSDAADSAMSDLRALGKVTSESSNSQDVTDQYVDLDSNLRNLQASEAALVKLMDQATSVSDVLTVQRELTNVRGQIERIQGRKNYLQGHTDMATISLSLQLPATTSETGNAWDPLASAQRGWHASLTVLRGVGTVLIEVIAFGWWLLPVVGLGVYAWRRRRPASPTQTA